MLRRPGLRVCYNSSVISNHKSRNYCTIQVAKRSGIVDVGISWGLHEAIDFHRRGLAQYRTKQY